MRPAGDGAAPPGKPSPRCTGILTGEPSANAVKASAADRRVRRLAGQARRRHTATRSPTWSARGAVTAWRRRLITARSSPSTVNQALARRHVDYQQAGSASPSAGPHPRPGEPDALIPAGGAVRRAAAARGPRDAAIMPCSSIRAPARGCAGWTPRTSRSPPAPARFACTARATGSLRPAVPARPDWSTAWLDERGRHPGPAWHGQRGRLTISGITQVVMAARRDAGHHGLRPQLPARLRRASASGADPARSRPCSTFPGAARTLMSEFRAGRLLRLARRCGTDRHVRHAASPAVGAV